VNPKSQSSIKEQHEKVVFLGYMVREWRLLQFALVSGSKSRKTILKQQQEKVVFLGYMVREWRLLQFALVCNFMSGKTIIKEQQEKLFPMIHGVSVASSAVRLGK
jgi:hypothetical protein